MSSSDNGILLSFQQVGKNASYTDFFTLSATASAAAEFAEHRWTHPLLPVAAVTASASLHDENMAFGAEPLNESRKKWTTTCPS